MAEAITQVHLQIEQTKSNTYLFYVDDLKLYASYKKNLQTVLETVCEYTAAVSMKFGLNKLHDGGDFHLVSENY